MILKTITVGNFRNIAVTTLDLSKITALVSVNNYGKSNLLEAIRFGFDFLASSPKNRIRQMSSSNNIPMIPSLLGENYTFSVEFDDPNLKDYRHVKYSFEFKWQNEQKTGAVIVGESIEINSSSDSKKYTSYLKRSEGKFRPGKSSTNFRNILLPSNCLAIDILSSYDDIEISDVIKNIQNLHSTFCSSLELSSSYIPFPIQFDTDEQFNFFDDQDIPKTLNYLKNKDPERYQQFLDSVYQLFPEFEKIELRTYVYLSNNPSDLPVSDNNDSHQNLSIHIKDELYKIFIKSQYLNQPISVENMSTGTKRIIWLLIISIFGADHGVNLIEVEEIETSIHPKMIRLLLESINDLLNNSSMLLSSHSPYLIQYLKPEAIYIGVPNDKGIAQFKRIRQNKVKDILRISNGLGLSVGEYIFELLSGDEDSAYILNQYLED